MAVISIEAVHDRDFFTKPYSGLEDLFRNCTVNDHKFLSTYPLHQELLPYVKQKLTTYDIVGFDGLIDAAIEDRVDALLQDSAFCGVVEPAPLLIATLPDGRRVPFTSHDLWFARRQNDGFQIVRTSEFLIFNICLAVGQACVVAVWKSDKGWLGRWNIDGVVQACVISADGSTLVCASEYYSYMTPATWKVLSIFLSEPQRQEQYAVPIEFDAGWTLPKGTPCWADESVQLKVNFSVGIAVIIDHGAARAFCLPKQTVGIGS